MSGPLTPADVAFVKSLVIHEDAAIIALNKPSGLSSQGGRIQAHTLDDLLAAFAKSSGNRPRLVHRLDRDTSGVILTADGDIIRVHDLEIPVAELRTGAIPAEAAFALGTAVATDIVTSIARRRTAGVLLRLLPGGMSIVAAAWYDWRATGSTGKHAVEYFDVIAPLTDASQPARV